MERNVVFSTIKEYLKSKMEEQYEIADDVILTNIGITSAEFVLLLVFVEDEFDITFEDEDLLMPTDITVGELVDRIVNLSNN